MRSNGSRMTRAVIKKSRDLAERPDTISVEFSPTLDRQP